MLLIPKEATRSFSSSIESVFKDNPKVKLIYPLKSDFYNQDKHQVIIDNLDINGQDFVILDHGGYFCDLASSLYEKYKEHFLGITEMTANGHYRYQKVPLKVPLQSIAETELKRSGDFSASQNIVHYTERALRDRFSLRLYGSQLLNAAVIGLGNLGEGIVDELNRLSGNAPYVYDIDPVKVVRLGANSIRYSSKEQVLQQCNLLFLCSGNISISEEEFGNISSEKYLSTVTSADDELELDGLVARGVLTLVEKCELVSTYKNRRGVKIHLIAHGSAVNTLSPMSMADETVQLFLAAHIQAAHNIASYLYTQRDCGIVELSKADESRIAATWLRWFS
ncbi:hypothetical protein PTW35_18545 (plasmid) [Photobacterium sp. DA100]|uniref:hypothetical protein n=1 Tax=Photobacterium sp. DA100 TaxID=3027472 RepID=UPI00247A0313|nr:hypothetical protein [Photobacterium sp. DA100]WEM45094.1 hypothetical protein PTW35_18545 [Photobacterium sp. DA100]